MPTSPPAEEPGPRAALAGPEAPEVSDEAMDLELATARGGQHRLLGRGWLSYTLWVLAPLGVALVIAAISSLPSAGGAPYAGGIGSALAKPPAPAPAPSPGGTAAVPTATPGTPTRAPMPTHSPDGPPAPGTPVAGPISPELAPATVLISVEAESGVLGKQLAVQKVPGASGGIVVTGLGRNANRTLTLPDVTVPGAGSYQMRIAYAAKDATEVRVRTSAGTDESVTCPATGTTTQLGWCDVMVLLAAGVNTVVIGGPRRDAPTLDRIILS